MTHPQATRHPLDAILTPWRQITDKVDTFFESAQRAHGVMMRCTEGCAACCQQDLTVLFVEALAIIAAIEIAPPKTQEEINTAGSHPSAPPCAFLDKEGSCRIYGGRPLVCRTHGLPIRQDDTIAACTLNFPNAAEAGYPHDATLNASITTAGLTVANALVHDRLALAPPQPRVALRLLARHERGALSPAARRALETL